jgi:hypothetical protein
MGDSNWDSDRFRDEPPPELEPTDQPPRSPLVVPLTAAALAVGVLLAVYLAFIRSSSTPLEPETTSRAEAHAPTASRDLGGVPDRIEVPPLDQTDALVRRLVTAVSDTSIAKAWLSGSGLLRNFVAAAVNLEEGATPVKLIERLRPSGAFRVIDLGGRQVVDPRSYERYDAAADTIVALDPSRVARVYATFKPRIEEAYRDLGFGGRSFDRALETVIVLLVRTPIPDDEPRVRRQGVRYVYVDESFENLTSAQKQYLRMGSRNVRRIDAWLRQLADALGIPPATFAAP